MHSGVRDLILEEKIMTVDRYSTSEDLDLTRLVAAEHLDEEDADTQLQQALEQSDQQLDHTHTPRHGLSASQETASDSIQAYLNEIGRVPLLSAAEEVELADQIARGVAAKQRLEAGPTLTRRLRAALTADLERANDARRHLTQANLRLVVSIAKKYVGHGLSLMDLIQEGNLGLMRAVEKFDVSRGNRFSTYATWWIRQAVSRSLAEQSRTIRLPVHVSESVGQVKRAADKLGQALGRQPTTEELADALGLSVAKIESVFAAMRLPISLQTPVGEDGESTLSSLIEDKAEETPADAAAKTLLRHDLNVALAELTEREQKILKLRYGLVDGEHHTLEEVGKAIGMTRERARQIEAEALRKIRNSETWRHLRDYLV
jgi:RNA polymerase primary sigma factor